MKETIHYIGDIEYFSRSSGKYSSKIEALKAHMKYIEKGAEKVYGDKNSIISESVQANTRIDSRIALKFHVALPNDEERIEELIKNHIDFFSKKLDIDKKYFYVAYHKNHALQEELKTKNLHVHFVIVNKTKDGRKIRINRNDLRKIHREYDGFISKLGYEIKRDGEYAIKKLGYQLLHDKELRETYKEYLEDKERIKKMEISLAKEKVLYPVIFETKELYENLEDYLKESSYSNIIWNEGRRKSINAMKVTGLIFDIDGTERIEDVLKILKERNIESHLITTKSHTEEKNHFRVIIPFDASLEGNDIYRYRKIFQILSDELGLTVDKTYDLARVYSPSPKDALYYHIEGGRINIRDYISKAQSIENEIKEIEKNNKVRLEKIVTFKSENWLVTDIKRLIEETDLVELIKDLEGVSHTWKQGDEIYIRTVDKKKYSVKPERNIAYCFSEGKGYGVLEYLRERFKENNINNIARKLMKITGKDYLMVNKEIFGRILDEAYMKSRSWEEFHRNLETVFKAKVYIDREKNAIRVANRKVDWDLTGYYFVKRNPFQPRNG